MMSRILFILVFLFCASALFGQKKTPVKIVKADVLKSVEGRGRKMKKLAGNVVLKHKEMLMYCDSAMFHSQTNSVDAYGHVHIEQGDSLDIYSDSLKYAGDKKQAALFGNVKLFDGTANLETDFLDYDLETKTAAYYTGAKFNDGESRLTSKQGFYHEPSNMAFFKDSVRLVNPDYRLSSDTMNYHVRSKTAYFFGPTFITNQESDIYCESGWYSTVSGLSAFGKNTILNSETQRLLTDSLFYNMNSGEGKALQKFRWIDTAQNLVIKGTYAEYFREEDYLLATNRPMLITIVEGDSLFLVGDTLKSSMDTTLDVREFQAYYRVRIFKSDLQAVCDSAHFSYADSVFTLFDKPVIWNENTQLTGDTIKLQMKDNNIERVHLLDHGFIVNQSATELFDQIKGRYITGFFRDGKMHKMKVEGNGQSIYFGQDDEGRYVGLNKAVCSNMMIYFEENKVDEIVFLQKPEATFFPMQSVKKSELLLPGFLWLEELKPLSKFDLNRMPEGKELPKKINDDN